MQAVDVPVLRNQTPEPGLEGLLTDEIRRRLDQLGYGTPSENRARLEATVTAASANPLAPKVARGPDAGVSLDAGFSIFNPGVYAVSATLSAKLVRGDELLWKTDSLSLSERFLPSDDLATFEANRRQAFRRLAHEMARELVERLTAGL